jgi:hypothetical protein
MSGGETGRVLGKLRLPQTAWSALLNRSVRPQWHLLPAFSGEGPSSSLFEAPKNSVVPRSWTLIALR